jgi:hypothetical protein
MESNAAYCCSYALEPPLTIATGGGPCSDKVRSSGSAERLAGHRRAPSRRSRDVLLPLSGGATVTRAMRKLSAFGAGLLLENAPIPSTNFDLSFDHFSNRLRLPLGPDLDRVAGMSLAEGRRASALSFLLATEHLLVAYIAHLATDAVAGVIRLAILALTHIR